MKNQVPSTKCPVCSQDIKSWEELVIDLYFEDILQKTSSNEDQVYIEADGSWKPKKPMEAEDVDSILANKRLRINGNLDAIDLSDYSSSEDPRPNRNKRQRTEVIDLTIDSDDGEDEYEYEYYDSESSRMDDMYFDMSFPSMTQEDIALIDAVEASTQGQNDRNLSVAERAGVRGQAVMTTRSSQQAVPTTSDSGSSHVNVGTGAQTNVVSVDSRNVAITNAPAPSTSATPQTPTTQSRSVVSPPAANLASAAVETSGVNTNESARTASLAPTPRTKVSHKNTSRTTPSRPRLLDTTSDRTQSSSQSAGTLTSPTGARGSHQTPARLASTHYPNVLRHFMTLPLSHSGVTVANFNLPTSPQSARVRQSTSNEARSRSGSLPTSPTRVVGMSPAYISLITNQRISGSSAPQTSSSNGPHAPNEARPSA
ncbi:E3 SUMO-protein ligase pli1 [Coemansia sp. RSA 2703]|nr:E3 SUMO-protein ligase pli1 [Coemansia sp. RSA 2703]